jgi:hypothetical protein
MPSGFFPDSFSSILYVCSSRLVLRKVLCHSICSSWSWFKVRIFVLSPVESRYMGDFVEYLKSSTATCGIFFSYLTTTLLQFSSYYANLTRKLMARRAPVARQATSLAPASSATVLATRSGRQPTLSKKQQENGMCLNRF